MTPSSQMVRSAKAVLRKEMKRRLLLLSESEKQTQSQNVAQMLFKVPQYKNSKRVSLYLNMREELQTELVVKDLFEAGKKCYIPYFKGPTMKMVQLFSWEDYQGLPENKWHIKQPGTTMLEKMLCQQVDWTSY
ncbi:hypothetical protein ScPMuIL_017900 [Solemya velum]